MAWDSDAHETDLWAGRSALLFFLSSFSSFFFESRGGVTSLSHDFFYVVSLIYVFMYFLVTVYNSE